MTSLRRKSRAAFVRAKKLMPGGVNSPARAFGAVGGEPIFFDRASGAYLYDLDGNRYVDYIGSWGPMILGHGHPQVVAALRAAIDKGTSFGAPTEAESELAELIVEAMPAVEKVRLVNSGTEATMQRHPAGPGLHGPRDDRQVCRQLPRPRGQSARGGGQFGGHARGAQLPRRHGGNDQGHAGPEYNDPAALESALAEHGRRIAGVIVEPVVGNMGCVASTPAFRTALRELCTRHGALLIFDEVMTGFRVGYGGAQAAFGVRPDLTTLGKIIGGGLPVGAYGGRADVMDHVLPVGKVFQAGTLSGNPLAMAAGIATLRTLRDADPYPRLEELSARLAAGLAEAARAAGVPATIARCGSMMTLFFNPGPVADWDAAAQCDTKRYARYFWGMIERGVYLPCSQFEALFVSAAHTEADIGTTIAAARESLGGLST